MKVRAAVEGDMARVRTLFREYAEGLGVDLCFQGFEEELATLPGKYAPPRGGIWLAEADDLAGCVALRALHDDACEMKRLFVRERYRRCGAGRLLAHRTIEQGARMGYRVMYLDTLARLVPAVRLYEGLGFRRCAAYYANPVAGVEYFVKEL